MNPSVKSLLNRFAMLVVVTLAVAAVFEASWTQGCVRVTPPISTSTS